MKKKIWLPIIIALLIAILIIPIPTGIYRDGGTREYTAMTYKIVNWRHLYGDEEIYDTTKVYFFPNNLKSLDDLWAMESDSIAD